MSIPLDAVVVGAGPNGLAAAIELARNGKSVRVIEANAVPGGGARTAEVTLPGFRHDLCSAIHPLAFASPFFSTLGLESHGLEWIHPPANVAHPLDGTPAAIQLRSLDRTAERLGADGADYRALLQPHVEHWGALAESILGPPRMPSSLGAALRFGVHALRSASGLAASRLPGTRPAALFAGCAGHSFLPLEHPPSAAIGLVLLLAGHHSGWPFPKGGSQALADALVSVLTSLGGEIETGRPVRSLRDLPPARVILFDVTPRQLLRIAGDALSPSYRSRLARFRYGPAAFKVDWALDGPIPWSDETCREAGTVHLGGTIEEIRHAERLVWEGRVAERPYVLLAQQSLFDPTRAPEGKHTGWAYCHVPVGYDGDVTDRIEAQVERFAPGFRDRILARSVRGPAALERENENLVDGDINGGSATLSQILLRPVWKRDPYRTSRRDLFLCSASTPPGGGVHGMCGYHAARSALAELNSHPAT